MTTRRNFLSFSATAAATAVLPGMSAGAMVPPDADDPPAIAALKSMRDKATPITVAERLHRLEHARELMLRNELDAVMLTGGTEAAITPMGVSGFRDMHRNFAEMNPMHENISIDDVGNAATYLCSDWASHVTGEIHYVDSGYNIIGL